MSCQSNYEKVKAMSREEMAQWLSAICADPWGYCKAEITPGNMAINNAWLESEARDGKD